MFQKKEIESHFDILIGPKSAIKGNLESEGSIRIDGKIFGNITALGNVIISESAVVQGDVHCMNAEIYGKCDGNVKVKGVVNLHQNASLTGDILAKCFTTKEGSNFKGNCVVDPNEDLTITLETLTITADANLVDFTKPSQNKGKNDSQKQA